MLYPLTMFDCSLLCSVRILHINFCSDLFTFPDVDLAPDPGTDIHSKIGKVMLGDPDQNPSPSLCCVNSFRPGLCNDRVWSLNHSLCHVT